MDDDNKDKREDRKGVSPLATAVVGAAIGAAAVALSNKKTRDRIGKKVGELRDQGNKALNDLKKRADSLRKEAAEKVSEGKKEAQDEAAKTAKGKS